MLPALTHAEEYVFVIHRNKKRHCNPTNINKCAKGVLKLHNMPAMIALLGDLGWADIFDHLNVLRVTALFESTVHSSVSLVIDLK